MNRLPRPGGCFIAFTLYMLACELVSVVKTEQALAAQHIWPAGIAGLCGVICLPWFWWQAVKPKKR